MCRSVSLAPKFEDNCVFREYGIIYYWMYWHFLIVNSFEKMDTRGHELSPTLEGGGRGNILCHIYWNLELCFYHFANLQLFSISWFVAWCGTFLMTNQRNSVTQIFNIIYWLTRTLTVRILIEIYIAMWLLSNICRLTTKHTHYFMLADGYASRKSKCCVVKRESLKSVLCLTELWALKCLVTVKPR